MKEMILTTVVPLEEVFVEFVLNGNVAIVTYVDVIILCSYTIFDASLLDVGAIGLQMLVNYYHYVLLTVSVHELKLCFCQ